MDKASMDDASADTSVDTSADTSASVDESKIAGDDDEEKSGMIADTSANDASAAFLDPGTKGRRP